jgi:xanthine dehydrogenase accessory factor
MAFADAIFDGRAELEGIEAVRIDDVNGAFTAAHLIPVTTLEFPLVLIRLRPDVLVDARMRKREHPESQRGLAPLTIGLGPNFTAGVTVDIAVETSWDGLGRVITTGRAHDLAGEPREIAGHGRDRYVYAPTDGIFSTKANIGDRVAAGELVAQIGTTFLHAPLTGALRGLTHDGVPVTTGTKVIEVDPRSRVAEVRGVAERPRRIAEGVLAALRHAPA